MTFIYHKVPAEMQGNKLFPLNTFKESAPHLYAAGAAKYMGRESLMTRTIPVLNCLWNDVIFLSPLHPAKVKKAQFELGRTLPFESSFFEIDARVLNPQNTLTYLYPENYHSLVDGYIPYDPNQLGQYSELSQATLDYFEKCIKKEIRPMMYHRVPHILYKGEIDITGCKIITP